MHFCNFPIFPSWIRIPKSDPCGKINADTWSWKSTGLVANKAEFLVAIADSEFRTVYTLAISLKGQCHEIFDLHFYSWIKPIWAPDK